MNQNTYIYFYTYSNVVYNMLKNIIYTNEENDNKELAFIWLIQDVLRYMKKRKLKFMKLFVYLQDFRLIK